MYKKALLIWIFCIFLCPLVRADTGQDSGFWHTVRWGEYIIGIARQYGINPCLLAEVNNLRDWNWIMAGDTLWIPTSNSDKVTTYTVHPNDYLLAIANRLGVSVWSIARANGIFNLDYIYPGQILVIPLQ